MTFDTCTMVPSFGLLFLGMHVFRIIYSAFSMATGKSFCVAPHGYSDTQDVLIRGSSYDVTL